MFIKCNKFRITFYITIFLHLALSIYFIKNVYQECDSAGVYGLIKNFPQSVRDYTSWAYANSAKAEGATITAGLNPNSIGATLDTPTDKVG